MYASIGVGALAGHHGLREHASDHVTFGAPLLNVSFLFRSFASFHGRCFEAEAYNRRDVF